MGPAHRSNEQRTIQAAFARLRAGAGKPRTPGEAWRAFEAMVDLARLGIVEKRQKETEKGKGRI